MFLNANMADKQHYYVGVGEIPHRARWQTIIIVHDESNTVTPAIFAFTLNVMRDFSPDYLQRDFVEPVLYL